MNITKLSLSRPTLVVVVFTVLIFLGIYSFTNLNYELMPEFSSPVLTVVTVYPGASPSEVENGVSSANLAGKALFEILDATTAVNKQAALASEATARMEQASQQLVIAVDAVSEIVEQNTAATEEMAATSTEVAQAIDHIASASEKNSAEVEMVSASTEEMSAQIGEVTDAAASLSKMAKALDQIVAGFKLTSE
jgi:methyl-accepting chemotaxis protein